MVQIVLQQHNLDITEMTNLIVTRSLLFKTSPQLDMCYFQLDQKPLYLSKINVEEIVYLAP